MPENDNELLSRISSGDQAALSAIYDRYERLVYGLLCGMLKDTDDAEDVMQEVFAQVWRKADTYQEARGTARNWLLRIAHNRAINLIRSKRMQAKSLESRLDDVTLNGLDPALVTNSEVQQSDAEEFEHVDHALQGLPPDQRILVELAFLKGYSHSEICEETGIPLGTVKTRIRNGLQTLRSKLRHLRSIPEGA